MASSSSFANARSSSWSELSPSSDFYYRPAAEITTGYFRIATILPGQHDEPVECRIREVSLKDAHAPFFALSYCWNSSQFEDTIWCDGRPHKVTSNLYAALKYARASATTVDLWIDQICVDQNNIIDRNEQVSKMGAIFRAASGVIVWLGEETYDTAAAMELPRKIRRYWPSLLRDPTELTRPEKTPEECPRWGRGAWPSFIMLLTRPWFRRLWVIQEVVCAKEIVVACGTATCAWDDFVALVKTIETTHISQGVSQILGSRTAAQYISFMQELRSITEQGTKQAVKDYANEESLAPYVLTMAKDCEATDHRDKLFAFHHIVRLWTRPDYRVPINNLYLLFAAQYLQRIAYAISEFSCDEATLCRRQWEFIYSGGQCNQRLELPSWVPDWSIAWKVRPLWFKSTCYAAGGPDIREINPLAELDPTGNPRLRLPLQVKLFDRVLAVGSDSLQLTQHGSHALSEALRNWLFANMALLHRNRGKTSPYPDQHVAIACTITAEQVNGQHITADEATTKYDLLLELLRQSDPEQDSEPLQDSLELERMCHSIVSFLRGRVFYITERGFYGLAQVGVAWGDTIAVPRGAPLPLLVRPTLGIGHKIQEYRMLCDTFVHGIMDGQAWTDGQLISSDILLV